jgi:hypothetical protein
MLMLVSAYEDINMPESYKAMPFAITTHHDESMEGL